MLMSYEFSVYSSVSIPCYNRYFVWPGYLGMLVQILINHIGIKYKVIIERIEWNLVAQMQYN